MLAHQEMFGAFISARAKQTGVALSLWDTWGMDNGAFTGFSQATFFANLKRYMPYRETCVFVVVPDVPFHWQPTLEKFKDWSPSLRRMGFPIALAVQDGATVDNIPWQDIDAVFIGGSTEWKRQLAKRTDPADNLPLFSGILEQYEQSTQVSDICAEAKSVTSGYTSDVRLIRQRNYGTLINWALIVLTVRANDLRQIVNSSGSQKQCGI